MAGELVARTVEAFYGGVWNDITADAENEDPTSIKRGVDNEGGSAAAAELGLTLNNGISNVNPAVSGRYSTRNAASDLFGLIGPNTPIRVSAGLAGGAQTTRMVGEVVVWPPRADVSQRDLWVPVEAAGVLRRLGIPGEPFRGPIFRAAMDQEFAGVRVAYWPCEEPVGATHFASPMPGVPPLTFRPRAVTLADYDGFQGSEPLPTIAGLLPVGSARAPIPEGGPSFVGNFFYRGLFAVPDDGLPDLAQVVAFKFQGGDVGEVELEYTFPPPGEGALRLRLFDDDGSVIDQSDSIGFAVNGTQFLASVELVQNGADIDWLMFVRKVGLDGTVEVGFPASGTFTGLTLGTGREIHVGGFNAPGMSFGHQMIGTDQSLVFNIADALAGWTGERAGRRVERLCAEQGVAFTSAGDLDASAPMGRQQLGEFLTILGEAAKVEAAGSRAPVLVEQRAAAGLHFNALNALYLPRTADLVLDYTQAHLSEPFDPTPDDFGLVNDATAKRRDGSDVRVQVEDGPKGITAAGRYDKADTFDAATDAQLGGIAGWWTAHGVWDEDRYPAIRINLRSLSTRTDGAALLAAAQTLDPGALVEIVNPPAWLPQETIQQIVLGISETISTEEWLLDLHTTPAGPFTVFVLGDPVFGRVASTGSELALGVDAVATELLVATDSGKTRWTTDAERPGDFPFAVKLGGEVVKVTGVAGTTSPQTFTVQRAVNGVVKPHPAGTRLRLARVAVSA